MKINTKNCITTAFSPTGSATTTTTADEIIIRPNRFVQLEAESRHRPPFFRSSTTFSSACSSAHGEEKGEVEVEGAGVEQTFIAEDAKTSNDDHCYISGSDDDTDEDTDKEEEQGRVIKCRPLLIMTPVKVSARQQQREQSPGTAPPPAACDMDVLATEFHKLVSITSGSSTSSPTKKDNVNESIVVVKPDAAPSSSSSSSIEKMTKKKKSSSSNKKKKTQQDVATSASDEDGEDDVPKLGRVDGNHFSYVSCKTSPVKRSMCIKQNPKYN